MPQHLLPRHWTPKLVDTLRERYAMAALRADAIAGLTVAIVALPLSMALAIASGVGPERGLFTAIVAGFLISALGGSRHQIGGPTGAFVVVVFDIVARHGYGGLVIATLLAGAMLIAAGMLRLGTYIKFVPHTVVTGFTAGIAVIIFMSQLGDLLGLSLAVMPGPVADKALAYAAAIGTFNPAAAGISVVGLATILVLRRYRPAWPQFLLAIVLCAVAAAALALPVATIGTRFGAVPSSLPAPALPQGVSPGVVWALLPDAITIFILAGIESLLSAVVADGMTGRRHRSDMELIAQGVANMASVLFGGICATGAIARTATNVRAGATSPVAGMIHALAILLMMAAASPLAVYIPMPALAAVLTVVAWNMSEVHRFVHLMAAPLSERIILLTTFFLTVFVDLTVAIEAGVVMAALFFMHDMAGAVRLAPGASDTTSEEPGLAGMDRTAWPEGVEIFQMAGPFFFGAAHQLREALDATGGRATAFVLRMRQVPLIDASGAHALTAFASDAGRRGARVILTGVQPEVAVVLDRLGVAIERAPDLATALDRLRPVAHEKAHPVRSQD